MWFFNLFFNSLSSMNLNLGIAKTESRLNFDKIVWVAGKFSIRTFAVPHVVYLYFCFLKRHVLAIIYNRTCRRSVTLIDFTFLFPDSILKTNDLSSSLKARI